MRRRTLLWPILGCLLLGAPALRAQQTDNYFLTANFIAVLNRHPDPEGWVYYRNLMAAGVTRSQLTSYLMASAEYCGFFGLADQCTNPPTNTQFLTQLYESAFHREPDPGGLQFWLNNLAGGVSRADVVAGFINASEFTQINGGYCQTYGPGYPTPLAFTTTATVTAGAETIFTTIYGDDGGHADVVAGEVQIGLSDPNGPCDFLWDANQNITLPDVAGQPTGVAGPGGIVLTGNTCSINLANSSIGPVPGNPKQLAVKVAVTFFQKNFVGSHLVDAYGKSNDGIILASYVGSTVVTPGPDFTITATPTSITTVPTYPANQTASITITTAGLNGFTGNIDLGWAIEAGSVGGTCFTPSLSNYTVPANSQAVLTLTNNCSDANRWTTYKFSGSSQLLGITHQSAVSPTVQTVSSGDFDITISNPTTANVPATGSVSYPVTIRSINGQSGSVSLSLSGLPPGVTYAFTPSSVQISGYGGAGQSTLTLTGSPGMQGGAFTATITGSLGYAQRTAVLSFGTQVTSFQVTSATGSSIVRNNGVKTRIIQNVPALNAPAYTKCISPNAAVVSCDVVGAGGGTVTLDVTAQPNAIHGTWILMVTDDHDSPGTPVHIAMDDSGGGWLSGISPGSIYPSSGAQDVTIYGVGLDPPCVIDWVCTWPRVYFDGRGSLTAYGMLGNNYSIPVTVYANGDSSVGHYSVHVDTCAILLSNGGWGSNCDLGPVGFDVLPTPVVPQLSCSPTAVLRGGSVTCTVIPSSATVSNWTFSDGTNTVTRTTNTGSLTWSGAMATSGTVSVVATASGNQSVTLTAPITVNNRPSWAFTAVPASKRSNPYNSGPCSISVPSSPQTGSAELGYFCLDQQFSQLPYLIGDGGPNQGYRFVYSASNSSDSTATSFNFIISDYLDDTGSQFAQMQCGNYNPSTNTGYISYTQLKSNTYEHESGSTTGHYAQYSLAQNNPANNLGVGLESLVGPPSLSEADFNAQARSIALSRSNTIGNAAEVEACNQDVRRDTACIFKGFINLPPYAGCQ